MCTDHHVVLDFEKGTSSRETLTLGPVSFKYETDHSNFPLVQAYVTWSKMHMDNLVACSTYSGESN